MDLIEKSPHGPMLLTPSGWLGRWWRQVCALPFRKHPRRLRVCESLSLGEKRLVAVVEYDRQKFLIGGGAQSVSLLARLGESTDFSELLSEWCERQR